MKYGDIKILIPRSSCIILDDSTYRRIRRGEQRDIIFKMAEVERAVKFGSFVRFGGI